MTIALSAALAASFAANVALALILYKTKKKPAPSSYEATELLHDLTSNGAALIKIVRVAPQDVFLRSPRGLS